MPDGVFPDDSKQVPDELRRGAELVAFALGQLEATEAEAIRSQIEQYPEVAAEFDSIRRHLDFHSENVPEIQPSAALFDRIRQAVRDEESAPTLAASTDQRTFLRKYGLSVAAAALLLLAIFLPDGASFGPGASSDGPRDGDWSMSVINGAPLTSTPDGTRGTTNGLSRIRYGDGVVVTIDLNTRIRPLDSNRLALVAGRIFLDVDPTQRSDQSGFQVLAGGSKITTTGTSFLVETGLSQGRVAVESGAVLVDRPGAETVTVSTGQQLGWQEKTPRSFAMGDSGRLLRWYEIPTLSAKIIDTTTIRVVLRNEMMDEIQLRPPTGGKPLFYVTIGSHNYPHMPENHSYNARIAPGAEYSFPMTVRTLAPDERAFIRCPSLGLETEALGLETEALGLETEALGLETEKGR